MKTLSMILVSMGLLAGCGASPDGTFDESIAEEDAALAAGPFTLRNFQTGLCLGVKAGSSNFGTPLITWYCDGSQNQRWSKGGAGSDPTYIALINHVASNRCLTTGYLDNGEPAKIDSCVYANQNNIRWKPIYAGNDQAGHECYRFARSGAPSKVFGVKAANTAVGTPVILWDDYGNTHPDQLWCVY
jgi:hypothetical protein